VSVVATSQRLVLYHHTSEGRVPVVDFTRNGDEWVVTVRDTPYKSFMEEALPTIGLYELQRAVEPHEGDLYLMALQQTYGRSSAWELAPADAEEA
jgi:hypothetical protein